MLSDLAYRLRALFRRTSVEADLDDELRFHFDREVAKYLAAGLSPQEARRHARLAFGGLDQIREDCREARGVNFIETFVQDIRYALRILRRTPVITAVAIFSLSVSAPTLPSSPLSMPSCFRTCLSETPRSFFAWSARTPAIPKVL
jgi:hypothetical protein